MKSLTTEQFIEKARMIHGYTYDYSLSTYTKSIEPLIIICKIHGQFKQRPNDHISDRNGCPKCKFDKIGNLKRKPIEDFLDEMKNVHGDRYDLSKINYKNNAEKIELICKIHGSFSIRPRKALIGQGCPLCSRHLSNGEIKIMEILNEQGYEFVRNKTFHDLKGYYHLLRLDFFIPERNVAIEYDGEFHSNPKKQFNSKQTTEEECQEKFWKVKEYDVLKQMHCAKHKINLLRISYKISSKFKIKAIIKEFIDEVYIDSGDKGFITKFVG